MASKTRKSGKVAGDFFGVDLTTHFVNFLKKKNAGEKKKRAHDSESKRKRAFRLDRSFLPPLLASLHPPIVVLAITDELILPTTSGGERAPEKVFGRPHFGSACLLCARTSLQTSASLPVVLTTLSWREQFDSSRSLRRRIGTF